MKSDSINLIKKLNESEEEKVFGYLFVVGITYDKDIRPNADEYEFYDYPKSKIPWKIMDENCGATKTYEEAHDYVSSYIENGVDGTCGIVAKYLMDKEDYDSIEGGWYDGFDFSALDDAEFLYSAYKKDDKIVNCI